MTNFAPWVPRRHCGSNANQSWLPIKDGEWVVKDRLGFYPVEDGVFAETYELVP
ncbi:hypothetical protein LINSTU_33 [Mycobacterium phage LinStu]|uniref:Uncharacterized protein n=1 Tax=Mycobacterium phage LinStu TaxID=1074307 RepID=G1JXD0_9CAUD|nr:hypothetical protein LINSTU_33 [Mycobacterium phage LinStu]AEL98276.1 hypothetical protein LINSTU_33 [Mycobacterium phage LinStu]